MIPKYRQFIILSLVALILATSIFFVFEKRYKKRSFQQINSFQEALPELKQCEKTFVLFDIDDVLISTTDKLSAIMGHSPFSLFIKLRAIIRYPQLVFRRNWEHYYSIMWRQTKWFIIEPDIVEIIHNLKKQNCIVLGLTSMETGSYGVINNFPKWRSIILKNFGLEFSQDFPNTVFDSLPSYRNNYPELYDGFLCCNQQPKGSVLAAFLDHFKVHPAKIIFFDDSIDNLISVEDTCIQRSTLFKGFHYLRNKKFTDTWDLQRALLQADYLVHQNRWLPDSSADTLIRDQL
jgi:hypothetical protein